MKLASANRVTLKYGATTSPYSSTNPHLGTDYSFSPDNYGYAVEQLIITRVGYLGAAGYSLDADGKDGRRYRYCHAQDGQIYVKVGQVVKEGFKLHKMGETGETIGKHLHFIMRVSGSRVDGDDTIRKLIGGNMPITVEQNDKLWKMARLSPPTAEELNNPDYMNNAGLAIDTAWNSYGKDNFGNAQKPKLECTLDERAYLDNLYKITKG